MFLTQVADIKPEVVPVRALNPEAPADVMGHPARNHIPRRQFRFLRFVFRHKPFFIHIQQCPTVTSTALSNQNVCRYNAGGMKLYCLRVSQGNHFSVESNNGSTAVIDDSVCGLPVDASIASRGDDCRLGQIHPKFSGLQTSSDCTGAGFSIVNEGNGLHPIMDSYS